MSFAFRNYFLRELYEYIDIDCTNELRWARKFFGGASRQNAAKLENAGEQLFRFASVKGQIFWIG